MKYKRTAIVVLVLSMSGLAYYMHQPSKEELAKAVAHELDVGDQESKCLNTLKTQFSKDHPKSEALWYLTIIEGEESQPSDTLNQSKATHQEAEDLAYLMKSSLECVSPSMEPTGISQIDTINADINDSNSKNFAELDKYRNGEITRGEYFKRYMVIKKELKDKERDLCDILYPPQ